MTEYAYLNKPIKLINTMTITNSNSLSTTDIFEVVLINLENGGIIETKNILEEMVRSGRGSEVTDKYKISLSKFTESNPNEKVGIFKLFSGINKRAKSKVEYLFQLTLTSSIWVPIYIKSIIVETPGFPEVEPSFKNFWTIPLNDFTTVLTGHIYNHIKKRNCINSDIIMIQEFDWLFAENAETKIK